MPSVVPDRNYVSQTTSMEAYHPKETQTNPLPVNWSPGGGGCQVTTSHDAVDINDPN